jgi:DNA-directed RNA polymerase specialized sigma subunit
MSHSNWECRYCDSPFSPIHIGDELICRCGAEWEDAKILVTISDEEYDEMLMDLNSSRYELDDEPWWSDPEGDEECNEDNFDEYEEENMKNAIMESV